MCSTARKKLKITENGNVKELRADRSLFARLLIVSRSQHQVDLKELLGKYEFSNVPRSLFHDDGTMNLCRQKSKLIELLMPHVVNPLQQTSENKEKIHQTEVPRNNSPATNFSVAIVDGMAELQSLQKSKDIITCKDLAEAFTSKVFR